MFLMNLWSERQNLVKEFQAILSHLFQATLKQCWYVVSTLCNVISTLFQRFATLFQRRGPTLCNVEKTSDFVSFSTSDQCYFNADPKRLNNVDPTLKCWLGYHITAWKFSAKNFLRIQCEDFLLKSLYSVRQYRKIRTINNSIYWHISRSVCAILSLFESEAVTGGVLWKRCS